MLEAIVLLMPLTLPAFAAVADFSSWRTVVTVAVVVLLGFAVQLIGVSVYVTVNEWHRMDTGTVAMGKWVFVPSASPVVVQLRELLARRNLSPWALRAFARSGPALVFFFILFQIVLEGYRRLFRFFRAPAEEPAMYSSNRLPVAFVMAAVISICAGFAIARPVTASPDGEAFKVFQAGIAAAQAGKAITAEEDYALALAPAGQCAVVVQPRRAAGAGQTDSAGVGALPTRLACGPGFALPRQHIVALGAKPATLIMRRR